MMTENSDNFDGVAEAREATSVSSPPPNATTTTNASFAIRNFASNNPDLQQMTAATAAKIDTLKKWTVSTYKNTKHLCMEQIGKIEKTVDKDLDQSIENLRELRKCYREVLSAANHFTNYLSLSNNMQRSLANAFCELAAKETTISRELNLQSELFALMTQNNEPLHRSLSLFLSSLQTLTDNTIEDTFLTIESHDQARLEFDISRQELQAARENPAISAERISELQQECDRRKLKYDQLKEDVRAKLVLLEENRIRVLRKQIHHLQQAFSTCYTGGSQAVERAIDEFSKMGLAGQGQMHSPRSNSFLEK